MRHIECSNFQTITVMYIKELHFWNGNESDNPFLISNFIKNDDFSRKWQKKNTFSVKHFCDKLTKNSFELKMPKFLEDHVKTHV